MPKLRIETDDYGQIHAYLSDGSTIRLAERDGRLELSSEAGLRISPRATNVVQVEAVTFAQLAQDPNA